MRSVKSSVKRLKTAGTCLAVLDRSPAGACSGSWLVTGTRSTDRSTRKSPSRKKSTAAGAPMFRAAMSPTEGSRTTRSFFPPASATRSASWAARTDGWISARAPGRRYWTTTPPKTSAAPAEKCGGSGAKARAVAMSIEDRRTDKWRTAGCEPRR